MTIDLDTRLRALDALDAPDLRPDIVRRAGAPEDGSLSPDVVHRSGRPLRRLTAAALALLVAASGLWFARSSIDPEEPVDTSTPTPPSAADPWDDVEPGVLTPMPEPPFLRQGSAVVWGAGYLFMWGGQEGDGKPHQEGGAIFDAVSRTWRALPPTPISARSWPGAVWAGDRFVVWGGTDTDWPGDGGFSDGASYDPVSDAWTPLAPGPDLGFVPLTATWTGEEVVFAGGYRGETRAVAYDPAADAWRDLPDMSLSLTDAEGVWTGREVVVFGAFLASGNRPKTPATGVAYDPSTDTWRSLPDSDLSPNAQRIVWDGTRLVAADYGLRVQGLGDAGAEWVDLPRLPTNACEGFPLTATDRGSVLVSFCGELVELSPDADRWHVIAGRGEPQPLPYAQPHGVDGAFLLLGATGQGQEPGMLAYRPAQVTDLEAAWDVAAAFGALRSHYPYEPDAVGEEILAELRPLISPFTLARYEDRTASGLPPLWTYYWGFEVLDVESVGEGVERTFVARIRLTNQQRYVERLTIGPGPDLDGVERDLVILDAVDGELVTEPGPYVITERDRLVATLVRRQWATFPPEQGVQTVRCADEVVDVPGPGSTSASPSSWLIVRTQESGEVDASCSGP